MDRLRIFVAWGAEHHGPTHSAALIRVGLALIIWVRFADEVAFFNAVDPLFLPFGVWMFVWPLFALIGLFPRVSIAMCGIGIFFGYFMFGANFRLPGWYHHHVYLLGAACLLLALTPCGRSWSFERWRTLKEADRDGKPTPDQTGPLWGLRLIGLQLSAIYFWTAVDKTEWAWVNGERLEQIFVWHYSGRALEPVLLEPVVMATLATLVLVVEYALAVLIQLRRWQPVVLPIGLSLHVAFYLFLPVDTYSITMILLYLALIPPEAVTRFLGRMQGGVVETHLR
ncbi:MAG: HTTM domain-containing protein [Pseudomonadota bacterium]